MHPVQRYTAIAASVLATLAMAGRADAQVIRITNANNHEIPIKAGSSVQIDTAGNLLAECALNLNNVCTQLSTGGANPNAPTVTLTRTDTDTDLRTGESVILSWTSTGALVCNATGTGPSTLWNGPRATAGTGVSVVLGAVGSYVLNLQCFNAAGGSTVATTNFEVTAPDAGTGGCTLTGITDPAFQPSNWVRQDRTWVSAFSSPNLRNVATFPNSIGVPVPLGANKGGYTTVAFTPTPGLTVDMSWDVAQANGLHGYPNPRPADSMFIGISPCPGDLRTADAASSDPWLENGCRRVGGGGSIFYSTLPGASNENVCRLQAGQTYYFNVMAADPNGGLEIGEHTCSTSAPNSANGCDVQVVHRGTITN
jgi:hypothetical protein